jgi:hypothetical protein
VVSSWCCQEEAYRRWQGWAGDLNGDVEGAQMHGLVLLLAGQGTGTC